MAHTEQSAGIGNRSTDRRLFLVCHTFDIRVLGNVAQSAMGKGVSGFVLDRRTVLFHILLEIVGVRPSCMGQLPESGLFLAARRDQSYGLRIVSIVTVRAFSHRRCVGEREDCRRGSVLDEGQLFGLCNCVYGCSVRILFHLCRHNPSNSTTAKSSC